MKLQKCRSPVASVVDARGLVVFPRHSKPSIEAALLVLFQFSGVWLMRQEDLTFKFDHI